MAIRREASTTDSSADSDQDFDPTAEMLVNDFDDEHTLEEEEAMESVECVATELDALQREGEMPLNELLAMYGYASDSKADSRSTSKSPVKEMEPPSKSEPAPSVSKDAVLELTEPLTVKEDEEEEDGTEIITVPDDPPDLPMATGPLLRSVSQAGETSDSGTDDDYSPDDDWRKTIQVGSDYQAVIPEGLCKYDDAPAYENEDRMLWDPATLTDEQVEEYLRQSQQPYSSNVQGVNALPIGSHIRDDEQSLFILLQCGHNIEEALRRKRMQLGTSSDNMSLWSEDECRSFECGLRTYGKDFYMIHFNKVHTRSVSELVQFYYLWKKTERHDIFASKNRLEKKKYALHPGTTDYMDRFLDEQENPTSLRDRSLSPNVCSLLFSDSKRRHQTASPPGNVGKGDLNPDTAPLLSQQQQHHHHHHHGGHTFLDALYSPGLEKTGHLHPSGRNQGPPLDCGGKDYVNGEDRTSSAVKDKVSSSSDIPNVHSGSLMGPLYANDKNLHNPPSEVASCGHHSAESSKLHDSHVDSCNSRFDSCREVTASTE